MTRHRISAISLLTFAALLLAACQTSYSAWQIDMPEGYAAYDLSTPGSGSLSSNDEAVGQLIARYVSDSGVRVALREVLHQPEGDLQLWQQTLTLHFARHGLEVEREGEINGRLDADGYYYLLRFRHGERLYRYLVGFYIFDRTILLIEAAGEGALHEEEIGRLLEAAATIERK